MKSISIRLMVLLAVVVVSVQCVQADLAYLDFTSTDGLVFNGNAGPAGDAIRLTPASHYQKGSAWYDAKQSVEAGFATTFDFRINRDGADGFAFVIQNSNLSALGETGRCMGYGGYIDLDAGIANSIAVEFDTYRNIPEPTAPHISVQTAGTDENNSLHDFSIGSTTAIGSIEDGMAHTVNISYVPGQLSVTLDDSHIPTLTVPVHLSDLLDLDEGRAWVGFTAGTGGEYASHDILSWEFTVVPEPATLLLLGLGAAMMRRRK